MYGWPDVGGNTVATIALVPDMSKNKVAEVRGLQVKHVSEQRLATYLDATYMDQDKALELYAWGRQLSAAFFDRPRDFGHWTRLE